MDDTSLMKNIIIPFVFLCFFLSSCENQSSEGNQTNEIEPVETPETIQEQGDTLTNLNESNKVDSLDITNEIKDSLLSEIGNKIRPNQTIELGKVYRDTFRYLEFNDDYDYWFFVVEKDQQTLDLIYSKDVKTKLVSGDELVVDWQINRIEHAGDTEILDYKAFVVSFDKISDTTSLETAENTKESFVISCGSGCAMTYSEDNIIANDDINEVVFKVNQYINDRLLDQYTETYTYTCGTTTLEAQIKLKGDETFNFEDQHSDIQEKLKSYITQFCD